LFSWPVRASCGNHTDPLPLLLEIIQLAGFRRLAFSNYPR
jgi:hypothetical protein